MNENLEFRASSGGTSRPKLKRIELKFRLNHSIAKDVRAWARDHLGVDECCRDDDTYRINSLYLDTPDRDMFYRTGKVGRTKHRLRRYGNESTLWLETKRKKKRVVQKSRTAVFDHDFMPTRIGTMDATWCGDWFINRIIERQMQPAVQVAYRRFARTCFADGHRLRLTIDDAMCARRPLGWQVFGESECQRQRGLQFGQHEVLELKFDKAMPPLFKELLRTFELPATSFSKYRTAVSKLMDEASASISVSEREPSSCRYANVRVA
ncbi:MAG: polyphosphate polymerase domain-containing protein [Planctomycetota bacterium]